MIRITIRIRITRGYSLQRAGGSLSPFVVAGADAEGKPLIGSASGAVRFWFRTYWASPSKDAPVSGPGAVARLVEMAAVDADGQALTCWSLDAAPDGSALILSVQNNNGCREVLQARLNWKSGESHLITLNYGSEATALYLDDQLAAAGKGVTPLPAEAAGMVVGSALDGRNSAQGEVEELFFLGRPVDAEQVRFYYGGTWKQAFLGPVGSREEEKAKQELLALEMEMLAIESGTLMSLEEGEDPGPPEDPVVYPEGSLFLEITGITNNLAHLIIHGTVPDTTYELLSKTDLTNSAWLSEGLMLGAVDQTNTPADIDIGSRTNQLYIWARSWADGDGNGLPDWWEMEYLGGTGSDPYGDPDHDGWTNMQEYQNGTHPNDPNPPPPPRNVIARLDSTGTKVVLTWESGGAPAASYEIHNTAYQLEQTVDGNTFSVTLPLESFSTLLQDAQFRKKYWVRAVYTTPVSATADSALAGIKRTDLAADVRIVRGYQGRWYLIVGSPPSDLDHILLEWDDLVWTRTQMVIPATNLVNGIVEIPSEVVATTGEVYYQLFSATGASGDVAFCPGQIALASERSWAADSTLDYADVRPHLRENLKFLLRSATATRPFSYAANWTTYGDWLLDAYPPRMWEPEYYFARPPSPTNYEYSGFRFFSSNLNYSALQELRPLHENSFWRNFMVDAADLAATNLPAGPNYYLDCEPGTRVMVVPDYPYTGSGQELPLSNSIPSFLYYRWFNHSYFDLAAAAEVGVALNTFGTTNLFLQSGVRNCYGLQLLSLLNSEGEVAFPGDRLPGWWDTEYYPNFEIPELETTNYYFASQTPFFSYNWDYGTPRPPMPGSPDFTVTNTSPLMLASFAEPMAVAGWARQRIVNGNEGKFAYLEQLFDHALAIGPNGAVTTNSPGTLSPYGEFFPTMPGPAALVTMPDLDTAQRGTGVVHVIKLQLDVNHDGEMDLSFAGPDNTSQLRPFRFWVNRDWDISDPVGEPGHDRGGQAKDGGDSFINSQRDLEDFARLWICGVPALPPNQGYSVTFTVAAQSGNPTVNLFRCVETNGGTGYLISSNAAATQLAGPPYAGQAWKIATVSPGQPFTFPSGYFTNSGTQYLLFEGAGAGGSGELVLTIALNTTNVLAQTGVWLDLHDVKDFYERAVITNNMSGAISNWTSAIQRVEYATVFEANQDTNVIVYVHGGANDVESWLMRSDTLFKRLYWAGYHGKVATVRWPSPPKSGLATDPLGWFNKSELIGYKSASSLKAYLNQLRQRLPNYQLNLFPQSLGGAVVSEALEEGAPFDTLILCQVSMAASAYDVNAATNVDLLARDAANPTPEWQPMGYHGIYSNLVGRIVNYFNTNDAFLNLWLSDQRFTKPVSPYSFDGTNSWCSPWTSPSYRVADSQEARAMVSRSRTLAIGEQEPTSGQATQGVIGSVLDLQATFGIGPSSDEHSAFFTRPIQTIRPLYQQLLRTCGIQPAP